MLEDGLLSDMQNTEVITRYHVSGIKRSSASVHEQKEELFEIMKRRSRAQYLQFLKCLSNTRQDFVINVLETDGGSLYHQRFLRPFFSLCVSWTVPMNDITMSFIHG